MPWPKASSAVAGVRVDDSGLYHDCCIAKNAVDFAHKGHHPKLQTKDRMVVVKTRPADDASSIRDHNDLETEHDYHEHELEAELETRGPDEGPTGSSEPMTRERRLTLKQLERFRRAMARQSRSQRSRSPTRWAIATGKVRSRECVYGGSFAVIHFVLLG